MWENNAGNNRDHQTVDWIRQRLEVSDIIENISELNGVGLDK